MEFQKQLIAYYEGEKQEALLLAIFGVFMLILTWLLYTQMKEHEIVKGLLMPFAFLVVVGIGAGSFNAFNNVKRLKEMPTAYQSDSKAFIDNEIIRFEGSNGVNKWWLPLHITWALCIIIGLLLDFFASSNRWMGVGIGLVFLGSIGLVIDGFAQHRAKVYTQELYQAQSNLK